MRISITDRCNLRCRYCMPEGCAKVPMSEILTLEEIIKICRAAAALGIHKIRLTGGEPLVRHGCALLVKDLKQTEGISQVTLTTNGQALSSCFEELRSAGLDGINISLDTLDAERYRYLTGGGSLDRTLQAIGLCVAAGIPTRLNSLILKAFNEDEILSLAAFAFERGIDLRFIELMPIGIADPSLGVPNERVLQTLLARWPALEKDSRRHGNGPAVYYCRPGERFGIGLISAMHHSFCQSCNRLRLTSRGQLKPCLCYDEGIDLKPLLKGPEEALQAAIKEAICLKPPGHCFTEQRFGSREPRLMSQIGG